MLPAAADARRPPARRTSRGEVQRRAFFRSPAGPRRRGRRPARLWGCRSLRVVARLPRVLQSVPGRLTAVLGRSSPGTGDVAGRRPFPPPRWARRATAVLRARSRDRCLRLPGPARHLARVMTHARSVRDKERREPPGRSARGRRRGRGGPGPGRPLCTRRTRSRRRQQSRCRRRPARARRRRQATIPARVRRPCRRSLARRR